VYGTVVFQACFVMAVIWFHEHRGPKNPVENSGKNSVGTPQPMDDATRLFLRKWDDRAAKNVPPNYNREGRGRRYLTPGDGLPAIKTTERTVTRRWRIIISRWRCAYARHNHNIRSEVVTASVKSSAEPRPFAKRTTKMSEISNTAVLRDPRATDKGTTTRVSEISSTAILRIYDLGVGNGGESNGGKKQRADFDQANGATHPFLPMQLVLFTQPTNQAIDWGSKKPLVKVRTRGVNLPNVAVRGAIGAESMT
jgi:hypothetical protein